tara:strand:+ start:1061 stop:2374 length:1314 start_codon:yes stop_codon:yes gene_type:complete
MAEVKTTNAVNVIEVVQAGPRGPIWSGEFSGSGNFTGSVAITGSLTVSGSGTLTNIGPFIQSGSTEYTGSVAITGSLTTDHCITGSALSASSFVSASYVTATNSSGVAFTGYRFGSIDQSANHYIQFGRHATSNQQRITFHVAGATMMELGLIGVGQRFLAMYDMPITCSVVSASEEIYGVEFIGPLTGDVTGNVVGNVTGNATGLSGTPSIDVSALTATTIVASSTIGGSNLSGTNTGDQDLSSYMPSAQTASLGNTDGIGYIATTGLISTTLADAIGISSQTASFDHISRNSDTDTYINFSADQMDFYCGGQRFIQYDEQGLNDKVTVGSVSQDMDFLVQNSGESYSISVRGDTGYVGIGTSIPSEQLEVTGDIKTNSTPGKNGSLFLSGHLEVGETVKLDLSTLPVGDPFVAGQLYIAEAAGSGEPQALMVSGG